ncbi:MAG: proton-conducting membrane transporter [Ruminococcaceae bacterium]|nr:proton-conducting membrane transporter [Oscillospiraceae bacterium]
MEFLILFTVALPVLLGLVIPLSKMRDRDRVHLHARVSLSAIAIVTVLNNIINFGKGCTALILPMGLSLSFYVDWFSVMFSVLFTTIWCLVGFYAKEYLKHEGLDNRFMCFYLIALGCLNGVAYAHNPFTFYTAFEAMTLTSFALVLHSQTKESIAAAKQYIYYSIFGALSGLIGIMAFYGSDLVKVKSFVPGGSLVQELGGRMPLVLVVVFISIIGFSCKAGMFPMHAWLPVAHPEAPAPASAVLSGLIAKTGVFAIIRIIYYVVGPQTIRGTWVHQVLLVLAIITIFMGSMMAYKEKVLKRRLAYSSVSQISYALFGVFMLNRVGMTGAILQIIFHAFAKTSLFLCAGSIIYKTHKTKVSQLAGLGKAMPVTFALFTIAAMSLVGVPLTGGFESKYYLALSALNGTFDVLEFTGFIVIMISALLTGGYLFSISAKALFTKADEEICEKCETGKTMYVPIAILVSVILVFGIWPVPIRFLVENLIATMGL